MKPLVKSLLLLLLAYPTLSSCAKNGSLFENEGRKIHHKEISFAKKSSYQLTVDSVTLPKVEYLDYNDETQQLSLLNARSGRIYKYQMGKGAVVDPFEVIELGVEGRVTGFIYLGADSILLIEGSNSSLTLLNYKEKKTLWRVEPYAEIRKTIEQYLEEGKDLSSLKSIYYGTSYVNDDNRFVREGDRVYFPLLGTEPTRIEIEVDQPFVPAAAHIDLKSRTMDYVIPFSEVYDGHDWGNGFHFRHSSIASYAKGKFLVSFPADHHLFVWDSEQGTSEKFYAGAYAISEILPKDANPTQMRMDDDDWGDLQPRYRKVLYDKHRNVVYRIATLPAKEDALTKVSYSPMIVVVLDSNMNYLGEWTLPTPEQYRFPSIFVSQEGLNIQRWDAKDEDHIFFDVFAPQL